MLISLQVWCLHPFGTWLHGVHFLGLLHLNKCNLWFPSLSLPFLVTIWASLMAQTVKNLPAICKRSGFDPQVRKIPWRGKWLPSPVFWSREFHTIYTISNTESLRVGSGPAFKETTSFAMGLEKDRWRLEKYLEYSDHKGEAGLKIKNCLPKYS